MTNEIISNENLSLQAVADMFKSAFFSVFTEEDTIYIQDNYKIWLDVDDQHGRFIKFETGIVCNEQANELQILRSLNQVNMEYIMFNVFQRGNAIRFQYYLWIEGGFSKSNVILTYRFFTRVLNNIIQELAEKNILA